MGLSKPGLVILNMVGATYTNLVVATRSRLTSQAISSYEVP